MGAWTFLAIAIAFEVAGTLFLKQSDGFTKWQWGAASIASYWVCFGALAFALKSIPVGIAYAVWAGVGIVAVAAIGMIAFGQKLGVLQLLFIGLILIGAIGLRLTIDEDPRPNQAEA